MTATRVIYALAALLVLVTGLSTFAVVYWIARDEAPGMQLVRTVGTEFEIGGPFTLTDMHGNTVTEADFAGRPKLVFFGFTHCPDICPTTLFELSNLIGTLGAQADALAVLFVSVDPERDTPEAMKSYVSSFDPRIIGLTGTPEQVAAVAKAYRVYYRKVPLEGGDYTIDHTAIVYAFDRDGRFVAPFNYKRPEAEALAELRALL